MYEVQLCNPGVMDKIDIDDYRLCKIGLNISERILNNACVLLYTTVTQSSLKNKIVQAIYTVKE